MKHTLAWLVWAVSSAALALTIRNPLYLLLIALATWLVHVALYQRSSLAQSWRSLVKLGAFIWIIAIPFSALMIHQGAIVLFRLPTNWPLVGGPITLEAILYGLVNGLALWIVLAIFAAFNMAVDASQLLRLAPPFLYQAGVVASIALTFMPQMLISAQEIREAQRLRGHRFRGWRDLLPLFLPLLTTALEHAIQLAESMESRGFGGELTGMTAQQGNRLKLRMALSLSLMLVGLFAYSYWRQAAWLGGALLAVATLILVGVFRAYGRRVQRSHYRHARWDQRDTWIALPSLLALGITLLVGTVDKLALIYYPYPPYPLAPEFNAWIGLVLALLALPGLVALYEGHADGRSQEASQ
jgi:energy-coupling factor transport system permease protein